MGHSFKHIGVFGRYLKIVEPAAALGSLQVDALVVGSLDGGCDQCALASVDFHEVAAVDPRVAGDVGGGDGAVFKTAADQDVVR